jgi:hypothetical protein
MHSPTSSTTYYVRAEGACNTTTDASKLIEVVPPPMMGGAGPQDYASPCASSEWGVFSCSASSGTQVKRRDWYFSYSSTGAGSLVSTDPDMPDRYRSINPTTGALSVAPQSDQYVWCVITDQCDKTVTSRKAHFIVPDPSTCP